MPQQIATQSSERRFLRRAEVEAKTGFKRAHIYALIVNRRAILTP